MFGLFNAATDANADAALTPDAIKERRKLARALMERGSSTAPVQHWSQGAARVMDALNGVLEDRAATQAESAGTKRDAGLFNSFLGGGDVPAQSAATSSASTGSISGKGYDNPQAREEYDFAISKGLAPHQAAAYVGAKLAESRFNPNARNPGDGRDGSDSIGAFQWNADRASALKRFAAQTGRSWNDPAVQREFAFQEMDGPESFAGQALRAAKTPEEATAAMLHYLRPGGYTRSNPLAAHSAPARLRNTQGILSAFAGQTTTPTPSAAGVQTLEQRGPATGRMQTLEQRGPAEGQMQTLEQRAPVQMAQAGGVMSDATPMPPRRPVELGGADMPAPQAQPAQGFAPPNPQPQAAAPAQPDNRARLAQAMAVVNAPFATPGQKAVAQAFIQREMAREQRDPNEARLRQLQVQQAEAALADRPLTRRQQELAVQEAERKAGRVDLETMTAPDGTVFEREKGKPGAQWRQSLQLPPKPADPTTDQRELEQANRERQAAGLPALRMDEYKTQKARAGATNINNDLTGGSSKQVFDLMTSRAEAAQSAASGLTALAEARKAVESGGIFGAGADQRLAFAKIGQLLGFDSDRITNTETFRSAVAPQIAAMVKSTVGSANISNADREFAERAAGGSIQLDERSIKRLLDIGERASREVIARHQRQIDAVYPDSQDGKFARERALFGVTLPESVQTPSQSQAQQRRPREQDPLGLFQ